MTGILSSMAANKLEIRQGDVHNTPNGVSPLSPTVLANAGGELDAVVAGAVMSKTTSGVLVPGILATPGANGSPLPLFLWFGNDVNSYPNVQRDRGMPAFGDKPAEGNPFWGIPATATASGPYSYVIGGSGVELTSTRFVTGSTYEVGTPITAVSATAANVADRGKLRPLAAATDVVVGVVTGRFTSPGGYDTLAFMAVYQPGTTVAATV